MTPFALAIAQFACIIIGLLSIMLIAAGIIYAFRGEKEITYKPPKNGEKKKKEVDKIIYHGWKNGLVMVLGGIGLALLDIVIAIALK